MEGSVAAGGGEFFDGCGEGKKVAGLGRAEREQQMAQNGLP